ncbi:nucleoside triphosphate pyrophosphohydrolase [Treponema sp.]|uniref:nucleoside triphosphate pyrophosphohydrolase n=1 Tax=Treponema sp. TaxID=166 RepID=UPI003F095FA6
MEKSELTKKIEELSRPAASFNRLYELAKILRRQCPWDKAQTPRTLRSTLIEETFEVIDAITEENPGHVREELGDALFNLVFIANCFEEKDSFSISQSLDEVCEKLIRRHPHIFAGTGEAKSSEDVKAQWDTIKENVEGRKSRSALDSVPKGFPPLLKAFKLLKKAAKSGFDWKTQEQAYKKIEEELEEVREADPGHIEEEVGDLLLSCVNLSRKLGVDPSAALELASNKFSGRFKFVEQKMKESGLAMQSENTDRMLDFWKTAKIIENADNL